MQGLPLVLLPRMLNVKDGLLLPALAAGEENVISGVATLMAELGQAVQNRASLSHSVYQCIITSLGVNFSLVLLVRYFWMEQVMDSKGFWSHFLWDNIAGPVLLMGIATALSIENWWYVFQAPELVAQGSMEALDLADSLLRFDTYLICWLQTDFSEEHLTWFVRQPSVGSEDFKAWSWSLIFVSCKRPTNCEPVDVIIDNMAMCSLAFWTQWFDICVHPDVYLFQAATGRLRNLLFSFGTLAFFCLRCYFILSVNIKWWDNIPITLVKLHPLAIGGYQRLLEHYPPFIERYWDILCTL